MFCDLNLLKKVFILNYAWQICNYSNTFDDIIHPLDLASENLIWTCYKRQIYRIKRCRLVKINNYKTRINVTNTCNVLFKCHFGISNEIMICYYLKSCLKGAFIYSWHNLHKISIMYLFVIHLCRHFLLFWHFQKFICIQVSQECRLQKKLSRVDL